MMKNIHIDIDTTYMPADRWTLPSVLKMPPWFEVTPFGDGLELFKFGWGFQSILKTLFTYQIF